MKHDYRRAARAFGCLGALLVLLATPAPAEIAPPRTVVGDQKLLSIAVRFAAAAPAYTLDEIRQKADRLNQYIRGASFGKTRIDTHVVGWYELPGRLSDYRVSPFNFRVDPARVRKLLVGALGAARADGTDPSTYSHVWIVVGVTTRPGEGYGMIAYCANPGMLSTVRHGRARMETIGLPDGGTYGGSVIVSAENAHVGHVAHDLLHALGGVHDGMRVVPDLYDYDLQTNPPGNKPLTHPAQAAIHAGPWGIMSQHFLTLPEPPPQPLAFTRLQLGWIEPDQVQDVAPGETREIILSPLAYGRGTLAVRIPIDRSRSLMIENRARVGGDKHLPSHGLLVSRIDTRREEGAGIVKAIDANPATKDLSDAPYRVDGGQQRAYVDNAAGVAVAPLSRREDGSLRLIVTTPDRIGGYLQ